MDTDQVRLSWKKQAELASIKTQSGSHLRHSGSLQADVKGVGVPRIERQPRVSSFNLR